MARAKRPLQIPPPRKKPGGPPKREPKEGERVALSLRMTPELKRRLDAAAEAGGNFKARKPSFA